MTLSPRNCRVGGQSTQPKCLSLLNTRRLHFKGSIPITDGSCTDPPMRFAAVLVPSDHPSSVLSPQLPPFHFMSRKSEPLWMRSMVIGCIEIKTERVIVRWSSSAHNNRSSVLIVNDATQRTSMPSPDGIEDRAESTVNDRTRMSLSKSTVPKNIDSSTSKGRSRPAVGVAELVTQPQ
jgi:hypothetical protein